MSERKDCTVKPDALNLTLEQPTPSLTGTFSTLAIQEQKLRQPVLKLPVDVANLTAHAFSMDRPEREPALIDGKEVWKYETGGDGYRLVEHIAKDVTTKGIPSHSVMRRYFFRAVAVGMEERSNSFNVDPTGFLAGMGIPKEYLKERGRPFEEMDYVLDVLAGTLISYKRTYPDGRTFSVRGSPIVYAKEKIPTKNPKKFIIKRHVTIGEGFTEGINFETGEIKGQYIEYPHDILWGKTTTTYEYNLRFRLMSYVGQKNTTIKGETLLTLTGASAKIKIRKKSRENMRDLIFEVLKNMRFEYTIDDKDGKVKDFRKWIIYLTPPTRGGKQRLAVIDKPALAFIDKYVEWACRPVHYGKTGQTLSEDRVREHITNTIKKHGLLFVEGIFNQTQKDHAPHPKTFWANFRKAVKEREELQPQKTEPKPQKAEVKNLVQAVMQDVPSVPRERPAERRAETEEERQERVNRKKRELRKQAERLKNG